ncbi:ZIP family metal transporter [Candidatus Woesearchaeota archaeon]|nr:ZIP family metal transporter [Candidatus Woesearchaeota archaeon]
MSALLWILVSVFIVSSISLIGVIALFFNKKFLGNILLFLISFAAGALIGAAFLDLIPEALEHNPEQITFVYIIIGILIFFVLERVFGYYHHHHKHIHKHKEIKKYVKGFAYLNLISDGLHNFLDGMVIAISFLTSFELGIIASIAVIIHEIPQEIGDFGILVYGGFTRLRALMYNFLFALTAFLGALVTYFFSINIRGVNEILLPIAAGNFIYLALADLLPEIHHEQGFQRTMMHVLTLISGIFIIWLMTNLLPHN